MDPMMVNLMVGIEQQLRILHWQTKSYAKHKAYGETYSDLGDLIDDFMEAFMGKYGRIQLARPTIQVINHEELDIPDFIDGATEFLVSLTGRLNPERDTDLLNIRDEMLGKLNRLKYLLTLE